MTNAEGSGRLDRIEALLEETNRGLAQTRLIAESNTRGLQETRQLIESNNRAIAETRQIAESNSRTIQAMLEQRASKRLEHEQRMARQDETIQRLSKIQEGLANMLVGLDEDRPTILRKLNTIENKIDRIIEEK